MRQLAEGVWQLDGRPRDGINVYLIGDVLIDAGTALDRGRILRELQGHEVTAHALTHAHPDHLAPATRSASGWACRCGAAPPTSRPSSRAGWSAAAG